MAQKKVLIAYGTRCGSTGEIAAAIGDEFCKKGFAADVLPAQEVKALGDYSAIILGSAVRMGRLMPEVRRLAARARNRLEQVPVAYFAVCMTMKDDTPKNRESTLGYLKPLIRIKQPVSAGLFAGAMDMSKLNGFFRWMSDHDKSGKFKTEDVRNWDAIRAWAGETAGKMG